MTSRSSFFKLMKEDLRQRLWTIILAAIVFLLPIPIYIAMEISGSGGYELERLDIFAKRLANTMVNDSVWLVLVTICGALICAVSGFGYLFSKKKVDFFHSLPVKREKLFAVRYINGVLIYLVPYLTMILVSILIMSVTGRMRALVIPIVLKGLVVHLLGYLALYTTFILCVTFVGNIVVFFAVSGWTFGITSITLSVYNWFEDSFFRTYSYRMDSFTERLRSLRFLCPEYFYVYSWNGRAERLLFLQLQELAFVAVLLVITLFVYRARPSDGAGKAIAFPILKPVIRISVEFLAGALMGMMFHDAADGSYGFPGWMVFGVILGVVLSHMLIQSIFHFDIRKCFAGKLSMGVCGVVTILFVLVMRYDTFGYDKYLPKVKKIESVGVELNGFDQYRNSYRYTGNSMTWTDELEDMELTEIDKIYPYLESLVKDNEACWKARENGESPNHTRVNVVYRLKNGKKIYREYSVVGIREDLFATVFESPEYKETHYSDIYTVPEQFVESVTVTKAMNEFAMKFTAGEREEFMTILRRELTAHTLKEKMNTFPVAILRLTAVEKTPQYDADGNGNDYYVDYSTELPIYPSFTETLRFLGERGFDPNLAYEWTGKEMMRVMLPEIEYKNESGYYITTEYHPAGTAEATEYVLTEDMKEIWQSVSYPEDWTYGSDVIPVEQEDYKRLYELCVWEELYRYGVADYDRYENYRVSMDVPQAGYNIYETYQFIVPRDADVSFLFD